MHNGQGWETVTEKRKAVCSLQQMQAGSIPGRIPLAGGVFILLCFSPLATSFFFEVIGMFPYGSQKWKNKRAHILRLDGYVDQYAKRWGRTLDAVIVHHIYPAAEYPEYAWKDWNLISISRRTHELLEDRKTGELTEAGRKLMESTTPGRDWRLTSKKFATR